MSYNFKSSVYFRNAREMSFHNGLRGTPMPVSIRPETYSNGRAADVAGSFVNSPADRLDRQIHHLFLRQVQKSGDLFDAFTLFKKDLIIFFFNFNLYG
jgi:hypothetical protein